MWRWVAIAIGLASLALALPVSREWRYGDGLEHALIGWLLAGILAAQLTALVTRRWRLSLVAPLLALALMFADARLLAPDCSEGCTLVITAEKR